MTVTTTARTAGPYLGSGTVSVYAFAFKVFLTTDVLVQLTSATGVLSVGVLGTDYSVSMNSDQNGSPGGNVVLTTPLPSGASLTIGSQVPLTQTIVLTNPGAFFPQIISDALDKVTILIQQALTSIAGAIRLPEIGASSVLPGASQRAGNLLGFDGSGLPVMIAAAAQSATALALSLLSNTGSTLVNYLRVATGAVLRTWQDKGDEVCSIKDFGAKTSNTDNASAIQAALNYAGTFVQNMTAGTGNLVTAAVYVPGGIFKFASTLFAPEGVRLVSAHRAAGALRWTGASGGTWVQMGDATVDPNNGVYRANIVAQDLCLFSTVAGAGSIGVKLVNCVRQSGVIGCRIFGAEKLIALSNSASFGIRIENNHLTDAALNFLYAEFCNTLYFHGNRCETAGGDGIVIDGSTSSNSPLLLTYTKNIIQGCQLAGIKMIDCTSFVAEDNDMEGNNLYDPGATHLQSNAHILALQGAQARQGLMAVIRGGFYSSGSSTNTKTRVFDIRSFTNVTITGVQTSGTFDKGALLASTVANAQIFGNYWGGCVTPVDYTAGSTNMFWLDETGKFTLGDSRTPTAPFSLQRSISNNNLAEFYNTNVTAGSVGVYTKAPAHAGNTLPRYTVNDVQNIERLDDRGFLGVVKVCPGLDSGAVQVVNGILYTTGGAPNVSAGVNGDICINPTGGAGSRIYFKTGGAWTGII